MSVADKIGCHVNPYLICLKIEPYFIEHDFACRSTFDHTVPSFRIQVSTVKRRIIEKSHLVFCVRDNLPAWTEFILYWECRRDEAVPKDKGLQQPNVRCPYYLPYRTRRLHNVIFVDDLVVWFELYKVREDITDNLIIGFRITFPKTGQKLCFDLHLFI